MPLWGEFLGGTYQGLSATIAADQAVNIFLETRDVPGSQKQATFYGTPGLVLEETVDTSDCRGWFTQDGRTWVVVGSTLYERTSPGVYVEIGFIADDSQPVSFTSNGQGGDQLGIVGGGSLYVLDLNTDVLSAVSLPFAGPVMIVFLDGYGLINQADSPIVWFSAIEDLTSWDALDFFTRSASSDNIVGLAVSADRVWVYGTKTTTLFYDAGDADTPFLPYPGTTTQIGLVSPWLLGLYNDRLFWVATSDGGQRRVMASTDQAQRVSTPPIDRFLSACSTLDDARMLIYEQLGHVFVAITAPSSTDAIKTYVYDAREQLWHARADWDATLGVYTQWRAAGTTTVGDTVLVGSYNSGALYQLDLDTYSNAGDILRRERTAPYLSAENQWLFLDQVELGIQAGVGLASGQGSAPVVELQISRDAAQTWVSAGFASIGAIGAYTARAIWRRLGRARSDRLVLRVIQTDPVKTVWGPGAWLRLSPGSEAL